MLVYDQIVLFGDSIFQLASGVANGGLPAKLADNYQRRLDIVVRGFSGYNTDWALPLAEPVFKGLNPNSKVKAAVIFFGSNDADGEGTVQHVPLDRYKENLRKIAAEASKHADSLIIVGNGIIDENVRGGDDVDRRTNRASKQYNQAAKEIAEEFKAGFVDLFTVFYKSVGVTDFTQTLPGEKGYTGAIKLNGLLSDGLHFTADAYELFYKTLLPLLPDAESLPFILPYWRNIRSTADVEKDLAALK